jgi:hypothetical protein
MRLPGETQSQYAARHKKVRRARGSASGQLRVSCDEPAHDWAQVHTEDGTDPWSDYVPLCRHCHIRYDRDARQNPESQERWRTGVDRYWTPEARAARGAQMSRNWTPERRATHSARMKQIAAERRT